MLTQAKVDLAVLWKLFQHSEANGKATRPSEICQLFTVSMPLRRVELALKTLESRGEVEEQYHPLHLDGLWQISRGGIQTVEKALRIPNSFIARLNVLGDSWLKSDEAVKAELSKNQRYANQPIRKFPLPMGIDAVPEEELTGVEPTAVVSETASSINWTKWGTVATVFGLPLSAFLAWYFN